MFHTCTALGSKQAATPLELAPLGLPVLPLPHCPRHQAPVRMEPSQDAGHDAPVELTTGLPWHTAPHEAAHR